MPVGEEIYLGHLARPFGIKGELKLVPSVDFWEAVLDSKMLILRTSGNGGSTADRPLKLRNYRRQKKHYVLAAEGIGDRTSAESLVGAELFVPADGLDVELPDKKLPFQVIGCAVESEDGVALGEVSDVLFTPGHDIYEVTDDTGTFLVPAVSEFVIAVDVNERKIVIRPIPGLIDDAE
jgi:16S rRNA processing protein RimM